MRHYCQRCIIVPWLIASVYSTPFDINRWSLAVGLVEGGEVLNRYILKVLTQGAMYLYTLLNSLNNKKETARVQ